MTKLFTICLTKKSKYYEHTKDETLEALQYFSTPPKNMIKNPLSTVVDIILLSLHDNHKQ